MDESLLLGALTALIMIAYAFMLWTDYKVDLGMLKLRKEMKELKHMEEECDILEKNRQCEEQEKNGLGVFVVLKKVYLTSPEGINHVAYFDQRNMVMYTQIAPVEDLMRHGYTWKEVAE